MFRGASAARRWVTHTAYSANTSSADAAPNSMLHILSRTPLALHSFAGIDVPTTVASAHAQHVRVVDLAGMLLPSSMGGLARSNQGRRGGGGMGSVFKNEVA